MPKFTVAIAGGGIGGLCLAASLVKNGDIQVNVYEASSKIDEIGACVTLWGRVCEALRLMGLANDCIDASAVATTASGLPTTTIYSLRGFKQPNKDFGVLPFKDGWSLRRADLIHLLLRRIPARNIRLGKRLSKYVQAGNTGPLKLLFCDGTCTTCDILVGCDGIRSVTRAQMMRHEAETTGKDCMRYIEPRWSGTVAYRSLIPTARLAAMNPNHSLLSGGQIYLGKNQHIIGHPISESTLNIAVSITNSSKEDTRWPLSSWSTCINERACERKIARQFVDWDPEAKEIIDTIDSSIEWAIMDLEPLPFYVKGRVALLGDAAHAAVPYLGASAAFAIEDAYVLSKILCAGGTTRETLPLALEAYQAVRRPYGNKLVTNARLALREFQYNGPRGDDTTAVKGALRRLFEEVAGVRGSGPEADANKAISWMEIQERASKV